MTTREGAAHLHPDAMKKVFVSTCRHMFPDDKPLLELARRRDFSSGFMALSFANKGMLEEGMGRFLFQVMDAEAEGEAEARRVIRAHSRLDPIAVATSLIEILMKTGNEAPFFAAIAASDKMVGKDPREAAGNGRMHASLEFFKACMEEEVGYPELIVGATLISARDDIVEAAVAMGSGTEFDYEGRSLFRGVFAISGLVFEDEGICAPFGVTRNALLDDYVEACLRLFRECPGALASFSIYFSEVLAPDNETGGRLADGRAGRALIRLFTDEEALEKLRGAKNDARGLDHVIDGIVGLDRQEEEEPEAAY
ncbi:MAG: hypothetical protein WC350_01235 [Candidatus Micrarchaeia archaeon]|jgi:hypothetical protein